jgi:hypothetical protein
MSKHHFDFKFILILLAALTAITLFSTSTGNFLLEDNPQIFVEEDDYIWVRVDPGGEGLTLISPDGRQMNIVDESVSINKPMVAKVGLDGNIKELRAAKCGETLYLQGVGTVGYLTGAPADGTWMIVNNGHAYKMVLDGKTFRDLNGPDFENCGEGELSSNPLLRARIWNWYKQASNSVYNANPTSVVSDIENPANLKLFTAWNFEYNFEDGLAPNVITTGPGAKKWNVVSDTSGEGALSFKSGVIDHGQFSIAYINIYVPTTGKVTFSRRVSSEKGYDYLRFYANNLKMAEWSGEKDWQTFTFDLIQGYNKIVWKYEKDVSRTVGQDAAWVDNIKIDLGTSSPLLNPAPPAPPVPPPGSPQYVDPIV